MTGDQAGILALAAAPTFFAIFLFVNRRNELPSCRHTPSPEMCYHLRCRNGVLNVVEVASVCAFIFTFGAGLAYLNDPDGWLQMSTPLIGGPVS